MKQIRRRFFETNSSSSHSISLGPCDEQLFTDLIPIENGVLKLMGGEFGWQWDKHNDATTKLMYLVTCIVTTVPEYRDRYYETIADEIMFDLLQKNENYNRLCNVIRKYCGPCEIIPPSIEPTESAYWGEVGYIDHQSIDTAFDIIRDEQEIAAFLFNPNSVLYTGNDNDGHYWNNNGVIVEYEDNDE